MIWIAILYVILTGLAWLVADSLIFVPQYASRGDPPGAMHLELKDGTRVAALHLPNPNARFTLWYFHGNAEALEDILPRLLELRDFGFSVFTVEYPGYGASGGAPSEKQIYATLEAGLAFLLELKVSPEEMLVYGRSLGGGPAVELASRQRVSGLVLESAFMSAYRVMTRWPVFFGDRFNNVRKLSRVHCPVLIMHGRDDRTVPFYHGEGLYAASPSEMKRHLWVDSAGHNDLRNWMGESYRQELIEFTTKL